MMKHRKLFIITTAITVILFMQPYVTWRSYRYHSYFIALQYSALFTGAVLLGKHLLENVHSLKKETIYSSVLFFVFAAFYYCTGSESQIGRLGVLAQYIYMLLLFSADDSCRFESFELLRKVLAILLVPAVIVFFLKAVNVDVPYELLDDYHPYATTRVYLKYPLSLLAASVNSIHLPSLRLCGMLDEPGAVGTFVALILCSCNLNLKDHYNQLLFAAGICTLSTAFFIIIGIYFVMVKLPWQITMKTVKRRWVILALSAVAVILIDFSSRGIIKIAFGKIFMKLTQEDLRGVNVILEQTYSEFGRDTLKHLFGDGYFSGVFGGHCSWPVLLHDVGLIGIVLTVLYICFIEGKNSLKKECLALRLVMLLSVLQRPYILLIPYVFIYTTGVKMLSEKRYRNSAEAQVGVFDERIGADEENCPVYIWPENRRGGSNCQGLFHCAEKKGI